MLRKQTLVRKANVYPQSTLLWMAGRAPLAKRAEIGVQKARQNVQHAFANMHRCLVQIPKKVRYKHVPFERGARMNSHVAS